jgi:hypothetical protein
MGRNAQRSRNETLTATLPQGRDRCQRPAHFHLRKEVDGRAHPQRDQLCSATTVTPRQVRSPTHVAQELDPRFFEPGSHGPIRHLVQLNQDRLATRCRDRVKAAFGDQVDESQSDAVPALATVGGTKSFDRGAVMKPRGHRCRRDQVQHHEEVSSSRHVQSPEPRQVARCLPPLVLGSNPYLHATLLRSRRYTAQRAGTHPPCWRAPPARPPRPPRRGTAAMMCPLERLPGC